MKNVRFLYQWPVAFLFLINIYSGCKKDAGEGGTSTIEGRVLIYRYDLSLSRIVDTVPASREDIFIIYGAVNSTYDDDFNCSYDGSYRFSGLQKGDYRLFSYSEDTTGLFDQTLDPTRPRFPVFADVSVTGNKSTVQAPDIIIFEER
ncbi:MAG: hypothetical protein ACKOA1_07250 [Bacteroidota bacterium]